MVCVHTMKNFQVYEYYLGWHICTLCNVYKSIGITYGGMCAHYEECVSPRVLLTVAYMCVAIQIHDEKVGIVIRINTSE